MARRFYAFAVFVLFAVVAVTLGRGVLRPWFGEHARAFLASGGQAERAYTLPDSGVTLRFPSAWGVHSFRENAESFAGLRQMAGEGIDVVDAAGITAGKEILGALYVSVFKADSGYKGQFALMPDYEVAAMCEVYGEALKPYSSAAKWTGCERRLLAGEAVLMQSGDGVAGGGRSESRAFTFFRGNKEITIGIVLREGTLSPEKFDALGDGIELDAAFFAEPYTLDLSVLDEEMDAVK